MFYKFTRWAKARRQRGGYNNPSLLSRPWRAKADKAGVTSLKKTFGL